MPLFSAADADLAALAALINSAYRGDSSRRGWTTEADFLDGIRITEQALRDDLAARPQAMLLVFRDAADGPPLGSAWIEPEEPGIWYLGLLTVRPDLQDRGLGRAILEDSETIARNKGARCMRMVVVHLRDELIAWYERRGYRRTGTTKPFPFDSPFGTSHRRDFHFVELEKRLADGKAI